jgi:hypothetical protein
MTLAGREVQHVTPVTLAGDNPAAETGVIAQQQWSAIRERSTGA